MVEWRHGEGQRGEKKRKRKYDPLSEPSEPWENRKVETSSSCYSINGDMQVGFITRVVTLSAVVGSRTRSTYVL